MGARFRVNFLRQVRKYSPETFDYLNMNLLGLPSMDSLRPDEQVVVKGFMDVVQKAFQNLAS